MVDVQTEMVRARARTGLKELLDTLHENSIRWDRMVKYETIVEIVAEEATLMLDELYYENEQATEASL